MVDAFELIEPEDAQSLLRSFPAPIRRLGDSIFQRGRVLDLIPEDPGMRYSASVHDGLPFEVQLFYDVEEGWGASCSCPQDNACEHMYAAMTALLAEHRTATVRGLSSGMGAAVARLAGARWKQRDAPEPKTQDLLEHLQAASGRKATREEIAFLRKVRSAYQRTCQLRAISPWEFELMGFPLRAQSWGALQIWPAFPRDEHEFWLYVAYAAKENGHKIPEFMAPITDLQVVRDRLARWHRSRHIQEWKQKLQNVQRQPAIAGSETPGETDFRLVLDATEARLEWLRPGTPGFEPVKHTHFNLLYAQAETKSFQFTTEGELIWQIFSNWLQYGSRTHLAYDREETLAILNRVLRVQLLESRIVNPAGQPIPRLAEPLRWAVIPPPDPQDDYRLHLVQADGSPISGFRAVLDGRPTLYLTQEAVVPGPDAGSEILSPSKDNRIPAPALESLEGVTFLRSLDLPLPERLRERVQVVSYDLAISCELARVFPGSEAEECLVSVVAEAPDGHRANLTSFGWQEVHRKKSGKKSSESGPIVVYDRKALQEAAAILEPLNLKSQSYGERLSLRVTRKFPETFSAWLKTVPAHIPVHLVGELASLANAEVAGQVKLDVTEVEIDWFDLRVGLEVADTTLTPAEIKLLLHAKGGYVRLKGKGWRRLQFNLSDEEQERLAQLGLSPRELSDEPQRLHALQLADDAAKRFLPEPQVERIQRRASELKARVAPEIPPDLKAELRPYQVDGFHFLAYLSTNHFGGILADDMGLGKTLQALAWLLWLRDQNTTGSRPPVLVICPKSVMDNWHAEVARFAPSLRIKIWSAQDLDTFVHLLPTADLHVLNYSQLRSLGESLIPVRWQAVILDEGQYIKNPSSQTAQIARALKADHRLILSGTPIENRLMDLWSLMAFAMPGVLSSRAQFGKLYDAKGDPFARRRLASRVRPFVLRRTKNQVARDLPERIEEDLFCEIEGEQATLYRAELKRAQQLLLGIRTQKELAQHQFHFLTSLLRLRQICCHARLLQPDSSAASAKIEALLEQIGPLMEEGHKVLVFSQFVEMLDLLQPALVAQKWPVFYLAGQTENRGALVREFQSAEGAAIFLISLKAGGFGLNLTAASYVFLFDPWWNPAVENQAIDRTHRIGQTRNVIAYRLLIKNSIEEKIRELQKQKKALAEDVLGEEKFSQSLTLNDLQFLFSD
jgi:hypothetical protein